MHWGNRLQSLEHLVVSPLYVKHCINLKSHLLICFINNSYLWYKIPFELAHSSMQNRRMLISPNLYQTWVRFCILQTTLDQSSSSSLPLFPPSLLCTRHRFSGFPILPVLALAIIISPEVHNVTTEASVRSVVCTWPRNYWPLLMAFVLRRFGKRLPEGVNR